MLRLTLALVAVLQQPAPQAGPLPTDAYLDPGAAELVARAREHRSRNERLVTDYSVTARQRIGVGLHALRRDRMLFGQELAVHIEWHRDTTSRVQVLGARQRVPIAIRGDHVPDDLHSSVEWLVLDPASDYLRLAGDDADGFIYPLREGSEADYRFESGDTTTILLPDGRQVRLLELRVHPRRADFKLMNGSLWFDADSYGLVRAVFAPARPFDIELDGDSGDADDIPAMLKPIRAEVRFVTIEYGLYNFRWWLMRYFAIDAEAQASVMKVPVRFERTYEGYQVQGGSEPLPDARPPAGAVRPPGRDTTEIDPDSLAAAIDSCVHQIIDSTVADAQEREQRHLEVRIGSRRYQRLCRRRLLNEERWPVVVSVPEDTASLLVSRELGPPILDMGDVISEGELNQLGREIGAIPQRPWQYRPQLPSGIGAILKNARYNRVEALSLGANAVFDFGRLKVDALGRIGVADWEPNGELGLSRPARSATYRLGAYRRLAAANPDTRPFGLINSVSALMLQRDDGEYFRTLGVELTGRRNDSEWWQWRLYAERQRGAKLETNASLPHLFDRGQLFRPNITAQAADEAGAELTLRGERVLGRGVSVGSDVTVDGATGDFDFGRAALTTHLAVTGASALAFGLEAAAGTSTGGLPVQSRFYLGGPATLRGYDGGVTSGDAFWRARAEVANGFPAVRLALFTDLGWAGRRADFTTGRPLLGAGIGASLLDGIIRMDLSRALRGPKGWRFDLYLDGVI